MAAAFSLGGAAEASSPSSPSVGWKTLLDPLFFPWTATDNLYTVDNPGTRPVVHGAHHNNRVLRALLSQCIGTVTTGGSKPDAELLSLELKEGTVEWARANRHRHLVLAFHGCPTNDIANRIYAEGLKPGPRGVGGIGVYGTNICTEAMRYAIDPDNTPDATVYNIVGFIGVLGDNPGRAPHVDGARKPRVVAKGKPHVYGAVTKHGVFHPDDTKVAFAIRIKRYTYSRVHGMWTLARRATFAPGTGACRINLFSPYGHPSPRMTKAAEWTRRLPAFAKLQRKPDGTAKNWLTALGSIVVAGFSALCARTSPQARLGTTGRDLGASVATGLFAQHMREWDQIAVDAAARATRGGTGLVETMGCVWDWAKSLLPQAGLGTSEQDQGCIAAYFRFIFDASVLLARGTSVAIGAYPEHVDHAEACVVRRATEFVRQIRPLIEWSDVAKQALGRFFPAPRAPIVAPNGATREPVRNSQLALTILTLGASGTSPALAAVVSDDDTPEEAGPAAPTAPDFCSINRLAAAGGQRKRRAGAGAALSAPDAKRPARRASASAASAASALLALSGSAEL